MVGQWLHKREDVAMLCAAAAEAGHEFWRSRGTPGTETAIARMNAAVEAHTAVCTAHGDKPLFAREVQPAVVA